MKGREGTATETVSESAAYNEKDRKDLTAADVRFTSKGDTPYAFVMGWPESQTVIRPLATDTALRVGKIQNVELLGYDGKLDWSQGSSGLKVMMPAMEILAYRYQRVRRLAVLVSALMAFGASALAQDSFQQTNSASTQTGGGASRVDPHVVNFWLGEKFVIVGVIMRRLVVALLLSCALLLAQIDIQPGSLNKPERLAWFHNQAFGLIIHWSVDSQTGVVISHSLVGADDAYTKRFFEELPKTFNPHKFDPQDWAALAKLAGIKYVVFTTKHHSGFAMWDTKTTDFGIMHTPYRHDVTRAILDAFWAQGIAPGIYFSPDDFHWLWENKIDIQRKIPNVQPRNNPELMQLDLAQMRELMTNYGPIDVVLIDGEPQGLRDLVWKLQPNTVVTRGAIQTPELYVPGMPLEGIWEAHFTMGTAWQYQPQNEVYKTGGQVIDLLVETRAKGGNLLLDVGPKPDGELPIEQEERLREVALWMQVNHECIYKVRPWVITNEQDVWFTKAENEDTLYAIVKQQPRWVRSQWRDFVFKSVEATPESAVSVLGQNGRVLEYSPEVKPQPTLKQEADGLHIHAMFTQRLQDNSKWPNPIVLKITHVKPTFAPPKVETKRATFDAATETALLTGALLDLGKSPALEVGFEYRSIMGLDASDRSIPWQQGPSTTLDAPGEFTMKLTGLNPEGVYEYRAYVKHPLLTLYGAEQRLPMK
jgi:alpha-L-fucosidase